MSCEFFNDCAFFRVRLTAWPAVAKMYQSNYCDHNKMSCARYRAAVACGSKAVPDTMFPNDEEGALELIRKTPPSGRFGAR